MEQRGAPHTFYTNKYLEDIRNAQMVGYGGFPCYSHKKQDPTGHRAYFDGDKHKVVLVEGLYVLMDQEPWNKV